MKTTFSIVFINIILSGLFTACKKSGIGENLSTPKVSISVSPENPKIGDTVTVTLSTDGQYLSIYTGDSMHDFDKSRTKAIMDNDWSSFYDTVYRNSLAKNGENTLWNRYLKDYNNLDDVKKDFRFFGAVSNISLEVYNDFPQSLINTTYPTMNQLKFTITDRRVPSGVIFKPNIYLLGGKDNNPAFSIFETRFVSDAADKAVRKIANTFHVPAIFGVTTHAFDTNKDTTIKASQWYYDTFQTDDPITARPSDGFYNFSEFYNGSPYLQNYLNSAPDKLEMTQLTMYMNGRATEFTGNYSYDLDKDGIPESYEVELDTATGFPKNESDYTKYAGFEGDVYISYINLGTQEYEPWNTGISLGSIYSPLGIQTQYKYVYTSDGQFTITAVATNIGRKDYSGDGYQTNRDYSLDEYPAKRSTATATVGVKN